MIQTIMSKLIFALLAPLALLAMCGLLHCGASEEAHPGRILNADLEMAGYLLVGLLLWMALLAVTDLPGGWQIITRLVWGLHIVFNLMAIPFWKHWARLPINSSIGFFRCPGIDWIADIAVLPVLVISITCFTLSFLEKNNNQP